MLENTASIQPQTSYNPVDAVNELLIIYPEYVSYRENLLKVYQLVWRGECPIGFFEDFSDVLKYRYWLKAQLHKLLDSSSFPEFEHTEGYGLYLKHKEQSELSFPGQVYRKITKFKHMEGLLLLSKLQFGPTQNESAHRLLGNVLNQVDYGLVSGGSGRSKRPQKHPLNEVFFKIGSPLTIEKLAVSLNAILPEIESLYPRLGQFLMCTVYSLACGKPVVWLRPDDFDEDYIFDLDKPPQTAEKENLLSNRFMLNELGMDGMLPAIVNRAFTAADLVEEMINYDKELSPHKSELKAISIAWRDEYTLDFFGAVGETALHSPWIVPILQNYINHRALVILRAINRSSRNWIKFFRISDKWRGINNLEPRHTSLGRPLILPKRNESGLNVLKGLLFLGRLEWTRSENRAAQDALINLINSIMTMRSEWVMTDDKVRELEQPHPLLLVLKDIQILETQEQLTSAMDMLFPEIAKFDLEAANLIGQAYLPLIEISHNEFLPAHLTLDGKKKESKPNLRKKRDSSEVKTRQSRVNIPARQRPQIGESIEETAQSISLLRRSEPSQEVIPLKEEIRWVHQRIYGTNQLLIRNHIESLSDAEALLFARALDARIAEAIEAKDITTGWLGILVALTLITGQNISTWIVVGHCLEEAFKTFQDVPQLLIDEGIFRLPVVRPDGGFKPDDSTRSLLEQTSSTLDLHLPPSLRCRIEGLLKLGKARWSNKEGELKRSLEDLVSELEPSVGTGISLARVRLVARARIREATNDSASTMLLCGDTFGHSTASLYYTSINTSKLEEGFRMAAWPLFGDQPASNFPASQNKRVGSELLVTTKTARALSISRSVSQNVANSTKSESEQDNIKHNNLVDHILRMLMATAGHRPTSALLELRRFDFDTVKHAAIFKDKQCDPAHMFRFLPISDLVSVQLERYLDHLRVLMERSSINPKMAVQARAAVEGRGSLFFHLSPNFSPLKLELSNWRDTLTKNWQVLPLNWGRHWLASRGREAGIDADLLAITLGHLDVAGYPFSKESPLEPAQLSRGLSGELGQLARSSGWVARNGLKIKNSESHNLLELGPLKNWSIERNRLASLTKDYEIEQRQVLRSALRENRAAGEKIALSSLEFIIQRPIEGFEYLMNIKKNKKANNTESDEQNKDLPVKFNEEDLENIQDKIDSETTHNKVLEIAAHNALYRYLKNAKQKLQWECPIPSPWLAPSTLEPTPFFPGIFRATNQMHALRTQFGRIPVKAPPGTSFTQFEWACGQAIIALCIFEFIDSESQILEIINGRHSATRSSVIDDLLLIETGEDNRVVGIRGPAAISIARLKSEYPDNDLPDIDRLNMAVADQLPSALTGESDDVLDRLCATVSVTNIVELSGLARMSLNGTTGCVAMSIARQRQMTEEGYGPTEIKGTDEPNNEEDVLLPLRKFASSNGRKQYKKLSDILHIGEGPKKFELTDVTLSQANIGFFRNPLCHELSTFLKQAKLDPLVACIGAFALHMTTLGTQNRPAPAWSTVYGYITSFGSDLVEVANDVDFLSLDAEEFLELYQEVIDRKRFSASKVLAARELINFHRYLQKYHGFENVNFSDLEGMEARSAIQVDAEVIQPKEYALGMAALSARASAYDTHESSSANSLRENRQAEVYGVLSRDSGTRHNELTALLFRDILATVDWMVLLIQPSRYRRLKTAAARRLVDITHKLTSEERAVVSNWLNAEKIRLGTAWKPTLPIFGKLENPKERAPSSEMRDLILLAMQESVGYRTKIHRVRHKVVCEGMLAIWLSDADWQALLNVSSTLHKPNRELLHADILLPRQIRKLSLEIGHKKSSTTMLNYFHFPWALTSRAHQALREYFDCHVAAVALGTGYSNAFKIGYRANKKLSSPNDLEIKPMDAWLTHLVGKATPTPGTSPNRLPNKPIYTKINPLKGRDVERILRDIQRDIPPDEACLTHGLTSEQFESLKILIHEVQLQTSFKILPEHNNRRSARLFQNARSLEGILDFMDRDPTDPDRQLVLSIARAYLQRVHKGERNNLTLPTRFADRISKLLSRLDMSDVNVIVTDSTQNKGFSQINILRSQDTKNLMNIALAWYLVVAHIVNEFNEQQI